ncbi:MAG: sigma-54 interaction domain-containing protein [Planctomycetota bacterium]
MKPNSLETLYRQAVLDALPCAVLVFDAGHRVVYWSPQAAALTGYSADEMVGATCQGMQVRLLGGQDARATATFCPLEDGRPAGDAELELVRRDGSAVRVLSRTQPIRGDDGQTLGYVQVLLDISILNEARGEIRQLRRQIATAGGERAMIGDSPPMRKLWETILTVAPTDASVVIEGETGTGKEMVARAIHAHSSRSEEPFIAVNCGALPETLLEAELFGHAKGAFTGATSERQGRFEHADGGTLLLDEVGEMSPASQVKLLRVLQEREITRLGESTPRPVDVRMIAATNRDLAADVADGRFREDLYYRLRVIGLRTPALRERPEDIPDLVAHFVAEFNHQYDRSIRGVSPEAMRILERNPWSGNVRQLRHAVEHAFVVTPPGEAMLSPEALPDELTAPSAEKPPAPPPPRDEKQQVLDALAATDGNKAAAARALGITRAGLYKKLKRLGIEA